MIWIDFGIIGLLSSCLIIGLLKGLSQQTYALFSWLVAFLVSIFFSKDFSFFLKSTINEPTAKIAVAFVSLFLITLLFSGLISLLLRPLFKNSILTFTNRMGGMLLGIAQGALLITIVILLAGLSVLPKTQWWKQSKLIPPFQTVSIWICNNLHSELTQYVHYN